jgi:DNA primase large subunit
LKTTDLDKPEYSAIIARAEQRISEAIEYALVSDQTTGLAGGGRLAKDEVELLSFPVAAMMIVYLKDKLLKKRYALAEAKRAYNLLRQENEQKITTIAKRFNLSTKPFKTHIRNLETTSSGFYLDFANYLKNAGIFHEPKWKLVNRTMQHGEVQVTKDEVARLTAEEIRSHMESKLDVKTDLELPQSVVDRIEKLRQRHLALRKMQEEEMPKETVIDAFPPCVQKLYKTALEKGHLSHIERFTLTSFLLNAGMPVEKVVECFRPASDFSEKMTRYQVEHIAGGRRGGERYIPPKCGTLRTHGICTGGDEICERALHPLQTYRRRIRLTKSHPARQ